MSASSLSPGASTSAAPAKTPLLKRPVTWAVLFLLLLILCIWGLYWLLVARFYVSTDDAYLNADQVAMAPRISGYVGQVLVHDNQHVTQGQLLVKIDPANYQASLAQQQATAQARQMDVTIAQGQLTQQRADLAQAQARLAGDEANQRYAAGQVARYHSLAQSGAEAPQTYARLVSQRDQADAAVKADAAGVRAAQAQLETAQEKIGQAQAEAKAAQAALASAQLDIDHTEIRAGISGVVGDKTVQVGQFVQPGTRLLTLVPVQNIYVTANFQETQLAHMRIGQHATVAVDALDGRKLDAVVQSFSPGTGAQFALLPPENATGNFTKIVQRVPVRLRLQADAATLARLVPGLSVTVTVDTHAKGTAQGAG